MLDASESAAAAFLLLILTCSIWVISRPKRKLSLRSVAIVVLGDIGRSPRMMYHAESFAKLEFETYLIGYSGSKPAASLSVLPRVHILPLSTLPSFLSRLPFILLAPIKIAYQVLSLFIALLIRVDALPEFILVQNPPTIPTLAVVWLIGRMSGCKVIIDWHNLGYTILSLRLGKQHLFVKLAKKFESFFGKTAYGHLFVTNTMRQHLETEWQLEGHKIVLHDRPPQHFHRSSPSEIHELLLRENLTVAHPSLASFAPASKPPYSTILTQVTKRKNSTASLEGFPLPINPISSLANSNIGMPSLRPDRPALLVSSTSWTLDEDFGILLDALRIYEGRARLLNEQDEKTTKLPKLVVVITGKGPLRQKYMDQVGQLQSGEDKWRWVHCISMWLKAEDYPILLGSADLGVSLHSSSSALDLPMKVVDMFGCGLPVCALDFSCLNELVKDGINGLVFQTAEQLGVQLENLFTSFPTSPALSTLKESFLKSIPAEESSSSRPGSGSGTRNHTEWEWGTWHDNWTRLITPLVLRDAREGGWVDGSS